MHGPVRRRPCSPAGGCRGQGTRARRLGRTQPEGLQGRRLTGPRMWNALLVSCSTVGSYPPPPHPAAPEVQVMAAESNVIAGPVRRPCNVAAPVHGTIHDDATPTPPAFRRPPAPRPL